MRSCCTGDKGRGARADLKAEDQLGRALGLGDLTPVLLGGLAVRKAWAGLMYALC